jgi:putative transposase
MSRKRYTREQVLGMLRQAEVELAQGKRVGKICRSLGISEQSNYRWRSEYGGLKLELLNSTNALPINALI